MNPKRMLKMRQKDQNLVCVASLKVTTRMIDE